MKRDHQASTLAEEIRRGEDPLSSSTTNQNRTNRNGRRTVNVIRFTDAIPYSPGPLPRTGSFIVTVEGATTLLEVAGSGFTGSAGLRSIEVRVNGALVGTLDHFFNVANVHETFTPRIFDLQGLGLGPHTVTLTAGIGLETDANDRFQATVQQFPG